MRSAIVAACLLGSVGCFHTHEAMHGPDAISPRVSAGPIMVPPPGAVPTELDKITFPPYVIEAPDNLLIQVVQRARVEDPNFKPPANNPNAKAPTIDSTKPLPVQDISGSFLVRIDGKVSLGFWGAVPVAGLSLDQAAETIRQHLLQNKALIDNGIKPDNLVVIVDVIAYNSKRYYVIMDGGGYGEQVYPFPITGSETVLDALGNAFGLHSVASKRNIWVARRTPKADQPWQILPVDWIGITQHGITTTNYQILPGDRIYVKAQKIVTIDTALARMLSPVERLFGVTLLGANTVNQINGRTGTNGQ